MAKWHGFGRCKTRLSKDIGKINSARVQDIMTKHTISVARSLEKKGLISTCLAISGLGLNNSKRWCSELGIQNFNLQGRGCLGEKMKRQILINNKYCIKQKIENIIFVGTDLPDLCHVDILNTIEELKQNDLILGPSNDGGYWLIAFSKKCLSNYLNLPFVNINWSQDDVLKNTLNNFSSTGLRFKFLHTKIDLDTINDIEKRK